jgi:hypothetical protein
LEDDRLFSRTFDFFNLVSVYLFKIHPFIFFYSLLYSLVFFCFNFSRSFGIGSPTSTSGTYAILTSYQPTITTSVLFDNNPTSDLQEFQQTSTLSLGNGFYLLEFGGASSCCGAYSQSSFVRNGQPDNLSASALRDLNPTQQDCDCILASLSPVP